MFRHRVRMISLFSLLVREIPDCIFSPLANIAGGLLVPIEELWVAVFHLVIFIDPFFLPLSPCWVHWPADA